VQRPLTTLLLLAALLAGASATAGAQPPSPPWKEAYLAGLRHEEAGQWGLASAAFERARLLRPEPEAEVDFGSAGTLDYDPYFHLARCGLEVGRTPLALRRLLERSVRAGVTPREEVERLAAIGRERFEPLAPPTTPHPEPSPALQPTPATRPAPTTGPTALRLAGRPPDAILTVDGMAYPPGTETVALEPGSHRVTVTLDRASLVDTTLRVEPGQVLVLAIPTPVPPATATATPTAAIAPAAADVVGSPGAASRATWVPRALLWTAGFLTVAATLLGLARRRARRGAPHDLAPTQRLSATPSGIPTGHGVGAYLVEHRLGSGGMATTYRARRVRDGKPVALKIPHEQYLHDPSFRSRFVREGQLGTQLHHPNVVRVLEAGEEAGRPFIAMELVDGRTLRDLITAAGEMPLDRALDITRQVAEALDYAHAKGVTHRDLKPENLMVERSGLVMVMDFGLARLTDAPGLTASSVFLGTPAYTAPEAISGVPADHRQDLYALGLVLFELLQGRTPHAGSSPLEQLRAHLDGRFPSRDELERPVPEAVWELLSDLVARDPDDRPASAQQVLVRLRDLIRRVEEGTL